MEKKKKNHISLHKRPHQQKTAATQCRNKPGQSSLKYSATALPQSKEVSVALEVSVSLVFKLFHNVVYLEALFYAFLIFFFLHKPPAPPNVQALPQKNHSALAFVPENYFGNQIKRNIYPLIRQGFVLLYSSTSVTCCDEVPQGKLCSSNNDQSQRFKQTQECIQLPQVCAESLHSRYMAAKQCGHVERYERKFCIVV